MLVFILSIEKKFVGDGNMVANPRLPKLYHTPEFDECEGMNTIKIGDKCKCMDGFIFGDPNKEGCFKCASQCHANAKCVYPGQCKCKQGYFGNGMTECVIPVPILDSSNTSFVYTVGGQNISIKTRNFATFVPEKAYCSFNTVKVQAYFVNATAINCISPPLKAGFYQVSVSYDNITWSADTAFIECMHQGLTLSINWITWIFIFIISIALFGVYQYYIKSKSNKPEHMDDVPLAIK